MGRTSLVPSPTSPARLVPRSFIRHLHARHSLHLTFQHLSRVLWSARPIISMVLADVSTTTTTTTTTTSDSDDAIQEVSDSVQSRSAAGQRAESVVSAAYSEAEKQRMEKELRKKKERTTYLFAAVGSTMGITFLAAGAVYYRFTWQTQGAAVPLSEIWAIFSLAVGASVGMEYWARWAHEVLWHDSLWGMHESHHRPRDGGPFELNDIFAVINAVPAIALMAYGFFHRGFVPGLCFGAGLGITVFGMAYMFVHDGLVHCRFPVGPIANVPYLQKVAAAHQLHHANKFKGVPYGLFLGPQELECQPGGAEELEKMIQIRKRLHSSKNQ